MSTRGKPLDKTRKKTVLIVEDSPVQAEQLKRVLGNNNCEVSIVSNGRLALDYLITNKPMVIITDVAVPEIDGYELCKHIKSSEALRDIPVVLLTTLASPNDIINGLDCGADQFIHKPYNTRYVINCLNNVLAGKKIKAQQTMQFGVEAILGGKKQFITSERLQILNLLMSTYEAVRHKNQELASAQENLARLNRSLEGKIRTKTAALKAEIAERRQIEKILRLIRQINHLIGTVDDEHELVQKACDRIAGSKLYKLAMIGLIDASCDASPSDQVDSQSGPGAPDRISGDESEYSRGPTGYAIKTGQPVIIHDILNDPHYRSWLDKAQMESFRSLAALPLKINNKVIGTLVVTSKHVSAFDGKELRLLLELAGDISMGIDRIRQREERQHVYEALRQSEASLAEAQRMAHLGNWEWDIVNNVSYWSDETYWIFGLEPGHSDATRGILLDTIHPDDKEFVQKAINDAIYRNRPYDLEYRIVLPDGSVRIVHEQGKVMRNKSEGPIRVIGTVQDVTERKEAEDFFNKVASVSPGGTYIIQEGKFRYTNSAVQKGLGYSEQELLGSNSLDYVLPEDKRMVRSNAIRVLKRGASPYPYEYRVVHKSGQIRWVMETVTSIQYHGKRATLGNIMDITEQKQMAKKMVEYEELNNFKSTLLSNVSHELRTPLTTIKGYATMVLDYDSLLNSDEKRQHLESISNASDRLTELVDHLLDMSRLDAGLFHLALKPAEITGLINDAVTEARLKPPEHRISCRLEENLPLINIDKRRIRQILDNLLDNAIKYSEKGTEILVEARTVNKDIIFAVTDQGRGIPASEIDKVFDRMYRIEQRLARDPGGMGLGLALCKGLVETHNGRIWVESEVNKGSTFYFALPLDGRGKSGDN